MHSVGFKECLRSVAAAMSWDKKPKKGIGRGIAGAYKSTGTPSASAVLLKMNEDGTVSLLTSQTDMGQGVMTTLAQIVADTIGLTADAIHVSSPDTDHTPYERSTTGSRATFMAGNSAVIAAIDLRNQLLDLASTLFEASLEDLVVNKGRIWVQGSPGKSISVADLWGSGHYSVLQYPLLGRGSYSTAKLFKAFDRNTGRSERPTSFWMYCAQGIELKVDEDTGQVDLIRIVAAQDVGKAINPLNCSGQIEGAVGMGVGAALMEYLDYENGCLKDDDWSTYKIPTILDVPLIKPLIVEAYHPDGPFGAKGVGEPGVAPTPPGIASAIFDATGVRIFDLPLTPEKIYWALKNKSKKEKK
jgi:carbon-monoxide dehydrogenase large subunit